MNQEADYISQCITFRFLYITFQFLKRVLIEAPGVIISNFFELHFTETLHFITLHPSSFRESDRVLTEAAGAGLEDRRPPSEAGRGQKGTLECLTDHPDDINIPRIIALLAPHTSYQPVLVRQDNNQ